MEGNGVIIVDDNNFREVIQQSSVPVLVDFWAEWCAPCRMMAPVVEEMAATFQGKIKVAKMDVEQNTTTPGELHIVSIPTLILFKEGKEVKRFIGFKKGKEIEELLAKHV